MQIRRETKIGVLTFAAIALLIWGYEFLKGRNILQTSQIFIAQYENTDELKKSNPIQVNGFQVGIVKDVYLNPKDLTKIIVELDVRRDIKVPEGTIAEINTTSMMGGRAIELVFPPQCLNGNCPPSGKYLEGRTRGFLNSMVGTDNLDTYLSILETRLTQLTDTLISKFSDNPALEKSGQDVQSILANLSSISGRIDRMLAASSESVESTLANAASVTGNLKESNEKIRQLIDNFAALSSDLKDQNVVGNVNTTVDQLQSTLKQVNGAVDNLTAVLDKINQGEGTLGMLVNDKELYEQLNKTLNTVETLAEDLRENPKRYTTILSKKSKPYEAPKE